MVIASMVATALPRRPQRAIVFRDREVMWMKWEARVTFLVYTLTFACILIMRDAGVLWFGKCALFQFDEPFVVIPLLTSIISLGLIYLALLEFYIRFLPHLMQVDNPKLDINMRP